MNSLNVTICGANEAAMRRIAQPLSADGVNVKTYLPVDLLAARASGWDLLLIELDGLTSLASKSLVLEVRSRFPKLPVIGVSTKARYSRLDKPFQLDGCINKVPRLEDLIISEPRLTAKYLYNTGIF